VHLIVLSRALAAEHEVPCIGVGAYVYIQKSASATEIPSVLRLFVQKDLDPLVEDTPTSAPVAKHCSSKHYVVLDREPSQPNTGAGSGHFRCNEDLMESLVFSRFFDHAWDKAGFWPESSWPSCCPIRIKIVI